MNKPVREIDKPYSAWIASQNCVACGKPSISGVQENVGHHLNKKGHGGKGTKCSDRRRIPLCHTHHNEIHKDGRETCMKRWRLFPELVIARFNELYEEQRH